MDVFYYIPEALWLLIVEYSDVRSRKVIRSVCRRLRNIIPWRITIALYHLKEYQFKLGRSQLTELHIVKIIAHSSDLPDIPEPFFADIVDLSNNAELTEEIINKLSFQTNKLILYHRIKLSDSIVINWLKENPSLQIEFKFTGGYFGLEEWAVAYDRFTLLEKLCGNKLGIFRNINANAKKYDELCMFTSYFQRGHISKFIELMRPPY